MQKERVLIIAANDMGNSGVPNVYMQIVRSLSQKYIFDIVITRENYFYRDEFLSYGGQIFLIEENVSLSGIKKIFWRLFGLKKFIRKKMNNILSKNNYKAIHCFKESESWYYLQIAKKNNIKHRIVHNNRKLDLSSNLLVKTYQVFCLKKTYKYSTKNISVSNSCGATFFKQKNFEVIYNTYDEKKYVFQECQLKDNQLNLLQIGTFLPIKNQLFSLDVIKKIVEVYPSLMCFFIGGIYDKQYYQLFLKKVDDYNLVNNVKLLPADTNQMEILKNISFTLIPSLTEGFSLVAIESQACGIKVFASSNVPRESNLGNLVLLELNSDVWASKIIDVFSKDKNRRIKVDCSKVSNVSFKNKIEALYNN